jgi:DHA2 family multidrug resistance protein-like MFS transporter
VLNTSCQVGAALGLATLGSISIALVANAWDAKIAALPPHEHAVAAGLAKTVAGGQTDGVAPSLAGAARDAFVTGMRGAMLTAGALVLLAAATTYVGSRRRERAPEAVPT